MKKHKLRYFAFASLLGHQEREFLKPSVASIREISRKQKVDIATIDPGGCRDEAMVSTAGLVLVLQYVMAKGNSDDARLNASLLLRSLFCKLLPADAVDTLEMAKVDRSITSICPASPGCSICPHMQCIFRVAGDNTVFPVTYHRV